MIGRTEVCGVIGAGKSTLARLLGQTGVRVIHEEFDKNPFLDAFYRDPVKHAFETELCFLLQHYAMLRDLSDDGAVFDFSIVQDLAYADLNLAGDKKVAFGAVAGVVLENVGWPDTLVVVSCDTPRLLSRIRERGRANEQGLTAQYLDALNVTIENRVAALPNIVRILRVRSDELNYLGSERDRLTLLNLLGAYAEASEIGDPSA